MSNSKDDTHKEPGWDGNQATWADYTRRVRLAYETTPKRKRKLLGPRLAMRLTGKAWDITAQISHERLRSCSGAKYLLSYLREQLGKTPIPDAAQRLEDLFLRLKRHQGEGFAEWGGASVRNHTRRCRGSLARARAEHPSRKSVSTTSSKPKAKSPATPSRRNATESEPQVEPPSPKNPFSPMGSPGAEGDNHDPANEEEDAAEAFQDEDEAYDAWWGDDSWWCDGWSWHGHDWSVRRRRSDSESTLDEDEFEEPDVMTWADLEAEDTEILPPEILGWLLLRRAGLSTSSRLMFRRYSELSSF